MDSDSDPTRPESHLSPPPPPSSTLSVSKTSEGSTGLSSLTSSSINENVDVIDNKTGTPNLNLSIQPQKMKKGKKNGGYNLRKSLAWDRAFFTEEGVLDSLELSKITGIPGELNGDGLSVINEHGTDPNSNNVGGFLNLETIEEDLFKEFPSGNIKTKSSQRIPPRHDVSKTVLKGRVTSSPMAPTSQKRLLNTGATKVTARNSKIPKLPASRLDACLPPMSESKIPKFSASNQNTCLPSITTSRAGARRNSLKSNGISQSAQKNVTSKVSFNSKNVSSATKFSSECTPKSSKPSTENAKKDTAIPRSGVRNHPAQHTTRCSILSEMTSNKGPSTSGTGAIKSIDKIRGTEVLSQQIARCIDDNKRNLQSQGAKPSGLRMPSPSLRFFGEPKAPISYVPTKNNPSTSKPPKSSVPVPMNMKAVNPARDLRPARLFTGVIIPNAIGKSDVSSQKMEKCSSSSILDPTNCDMTEYKDNQYVVEEEKVLSGAKSLKQTNDKQSRSQHLDISGKCHMHHVPTTFEDKEDGDKDENLVLSHVECAEATRITPVFFNIGDETNSKSSIGSSCEKQLSCASETIRGVQPKFVEDMEQNSPAVKDEVMPEFQNSYINCIRLSSAADGGTFSNSLYDNKPSEKSNICSSEHSSDERSMDVCIDGGSSLKLKDDDPVIVVCEDRDVILETSQLLSSTKNSAECNQMIGDYDQQQQQHVSSEGDIQRLGDLFKDEEGDISNVSPGHANDEEGDMVIDKKWPMMDVNECSEVKGKVRGKDYQQLKSGDWSLDDKQFLLNSKNLDHEKMSNVGPEVQACKMNANTEEDVTDTILPLLNVDECLEAQGNARENYYQVDHTYMTFRHEQPSHPCEHGIIDIDGSDICTSTSDTQCLDGTSDANNLEERCASSNELPKEEPAQRSIKSDWTAAMVLVEDHIQFRNQEDTQVEISNDVNEVSRSSEKVDQTDFLASTSGKESNDLDLSPPATIPATEKSCSSDSQYKLQPRDESTKAILEEYVEHVKSEGSVSPREPETEIFQDVNRISSENLCSNKDIDCMCEEDTHSKLITCKGGEKLTRLAVNVAPFSDEWLAAIEAAGEEILTLKTGAVQNSPPDKSIPEPSPWSPVKKKTNQEIGPFDCTKYKNAQHISD